MNKIIIIGTPVTGFTHVGPFLDEEDANIYANRAFSHKKWCVVDLSQPRDEFLPKDEDQIHPPAVPESKLTALMSPKTVMMSPRTQCDCSGCPACGTHCIKRCASGNGVACNALTISVSPPNRRRG